jgi:hypothetical protein
MGYLLRLVPLLLLSCASLVLTAPHQVCPFGELDYQRALGLLEAGQSTQPLIDSLAGCHFESDYWVNLTLRLAVKQHDLGLSSFLIGRIELVPKDRNPSLSLVLWMALSYGDKAFVRHLWEMDFKITRRHYFYRGITEDNLEFVKLLVAERPERALQITPHARDMDVLDFSQAMRVIGLALHCNSVSEDAAALFNPTSLLSGLLKSNMLDDVGMAQVIGRLCELGAQVSQKHIKRLAKYHPGFAESRVTLGLYRDAQNQVKEPEGN